MKVLSNLLAFAGIICLLSAAGGADAEYITGESYPFIGIVLWTAIGAGLIFAALMTGGEK